MNQPIYDVNWFLDFFSAIPEDKWCVCALERGDTRCANGHLNYRVHGSGQWPDGQPPASVFALTDLTQKHLGLSAPDINNGNFFNVVTRFPQPTPRARILAALTDIKSQQEQAAEAFELRPLNLTKPERKETIESIA